MTWHLQASEYQWQPTEAGGLQLSVSVGDFLAGIREFQQADSAGQLGRRLPVTRLFALQGRMASGPVTLAGPDWSHHVRGADLIADWPYSEQVPTGIECYWRPQELAGGGLMLEWLVSANTRLLDEQIHWQVESELELEWLELGRTDAAGDVAEWQPLPDGQTETGSTTSPWQEPLLGQLSLLAKLPGRGGYLALAAAAGDLHSIKVTLQRGDAGLSRATLQQVLQMGFLEKGVIRRARLWMLWLPDSELIHQDLQARLQAFYLSPQPLTV